MSAACTAVSVDSMTAGDAERARLECNPGVEAGSADWARACLMGDLKINLYFMLFIKEKQVKLTLRFSI